MADIPKHKLALVVCYFGPAPWYLDLFLKSCAFNPDVDFIIAGDVPHAVVTWPDNVRQIPMNIGEFQRRASDRLGLAVNVSHPYKLCDLKPAYGVIFSDYLAPYDFWGHCDPDVIFGEIRGFITPELLETYDVICVREEYVTGFFTLFRNTGYVNRLYEQSRDYRTVFSREEHFCFDECSFAWLPLMNGRDIFEVTTAIESMTHVVKRLDRQDVIRAHFQFMVIEGTSGRLTWDHGHLYYDERIEALLYHLIQFKKQDDLVLPEWTAVPDAFHIGRNFFQAAGFAGQ
jgi:hypothetical protein